MPHIHTKPGQYDFTASAFIIRTDFDVPKIMLHKHKKLNKWLQFGGHVELDESPWSAIEHELLEETGYELNQLKLLQPKIRFKGNQYSDLEWHPVPLEMNTHKIQDGTDHYHMDTSYAFVTDQQPKNPIAENESSEVGFFSITELKNKPKDTYEANIEICLYALENVYQVWEQVSLA